MCTRRLRGHISPLQCVRVGYEATFPPLQCVRVGYEATFPPLQCVRVGYEATFLRYNVYASATRPHFLTRRLTDTE